MNLLLMSLFLLLGLIIGSFLNVIICRLNTKKSLSGRSGCMSCQSQLRFYELVPLVSFFILRGRCRTCRTKISYMYPLVELTTGLIFLALFLKLQDILFFSLSSFVITYLFYSIIFSILIVITVYDLRHKIIPDMLSFLFGFLAFIGLFIFDTSLFAGLPVFSFHIPSLLELLSGILIATPFALLWLISRGTWMGLGDAKLALGLGWLLGLSGAISGVVISFWAGALIGLCLMAVSKKYSMKSELPFALYLFLGTLLVFFFDFQVIPIIY